MKSTRAENELIQSIVDHYDANKPKLKTFLLDQISSMLTGSEALAKYVHSFKFRLKSSESLRRKLQEKLVAAKEKNKNFKITPQNLFIEINDLVGIRVLHLHTRQMAQINPILRELLHEGRYNIIEGPFARTWDDETKDFFTQIGIETRESGASMYTSVHYVIDSNSRTRYTAEIQVRTLAEELWGEVTHVIDYPTPCPNLACKEQIRVLARAASSCTRLVDSIFRSYEDFVKNGPKNRRSDKNR